MAGEVAELAEPLNELKIASLWACDADLEEQIHAQERKVGLNGLQVAESPGLCRRPLAAPPFAAACEACHIDAL
jgi:hypothetical protein